MLPSLTKPVSSTELLAQTPTQQKAKADRLLQQGIVQYSTSQYQAALQSWQEALKIYQAIGDRNGVANSLGNLGMACDSIGQYKKAIEYHQQSLAIFKEIGDRQGKTSVLNNLGITYHRLGQYEKAIEYHQQSLTIAKEIGARQGITNSLNNLGNAYINLGQYEKAIEYHQQSLTIAKEIGDRIKVANSLINLGDAYTNLGQYEKGIAYLQQSLTIAREIGERIKVASSLGNLGIVYRHLGQYKKAIEYHQQSLTIVKEIGARYEEASSLNNLGNAYINLGQYEKAIEYHQQSLTIAQEIGDRIKVANSLGGLGITYHRLGQHEKAIDFFQQSLTIAREIGARNGEGSSLGNLGLAYDSLGQYEKAIEYHQQWLTIAQEIGDRQGVASSQNNLGLTYARLGELPKAEEILLEGIKMLEYLRQDGGNDTNKVSIFDTQINSYEILQKVRVALNKTNEALEIADRSRAKGLVDLLNTRLSDNPEELKVNPLKIQEIQQIAKNKQATLVLYSLIDDEIFTWVIKPTGEVEFKRQKNESDLNELVEVARDSIGVQDRGVIKLVPMSESDQIQQREKLQQLHQLLIEPIANFLPKNPDEPVIFLPQGALFLVPFPALQDAEGNYLVDQHTILTAPSIQTLQLTQQQRQRVGGEGVLIVGNPTMPRLPQEIGEDPVQLTPLAGAETEANEIAKFFNTDAMIGSQATKSAVLEQISNARVVHLATHGLLDDFGLGVPGAIALAPDPNFTPEIGEFNGLLTAGEIFDLDLSAELVVLSACNTGRGQIRGEGVIGLSRSLIQAGVPSVLVSLWQVPDAPTAELMVEFYRNSEEKNLDKAQALRQAMLTIKANYPNPRNWAAFTLIGEAD
ncbi:MAG: CHAT domain-containing tetratricopeptide repeat protein [Microcoleaceae cyanobacterium]